MCWQRISHMRISWALTASWSGLRQAHWTMGGEELWNGGDNRTVYQSQEKICLLCWCLKIFLTTYPTGLNQLKDGAAWTKRQENEWGSEQKINFHNSEYIRILEEMLFKLNTNIAGPLFHTNIENFQHSYSPSVSTSQQGTSLAISPPILNGPKSYFETLRKGHNLFFPPAINHAKRSW